MAERDPVGLDGANIHPSEPWVQSSGVGLSHEQCPPSFQRVQLFRGQISTQGSPQQFSNDLPQPAQHDPGTPRQALGI